MKLKILDEGGGDDDIILLCLIRINVEVADVDPIIGDGTVVVGRVCDLILDADINRHFGAAA